MKELYEVSPMRTALMWGVICTLSIAALQLILYILNYDSEIVTGLLNLLIMAVCIALAISNHREKDLGGYLPFSRGLGTGMLVALFIGIGLVAWSLLYLHVINPGLIEERIAERLENMNLSDDEYEEVRRSMDFWAGPGMTAATTLLSMGFFGLILSLIFSAIFMKKRVN